MKKLFLVFALVSCYSITYSNNTAVRSDWILQCIRCPVNFSFTNNQGCTITVQGTVDYINGHWIPASFQGTISFGSQNCNNCPCGSVTFGGTNSVGVVFDDPDDICNSNTVIFTGGSVYVTELNKVADRFLSQLKSTLGC